MAGPPAGAAEGAAGERMRVGETAPSGGLGGAQELIDEETGDRRRERREAKSATRTIAPAPRTAPRRAT